MENLDNAPRIGDDCISRRGSVLGSRGERGGEDCDGRRGDEERGDGTAGRCGEEKSRLNIGVGIVANMSSLVFERGIGDAKCLVGLKQRFRSQECSWWLLFSKMRC